MRDQWRAGDDHRDSNRRRNRATHDRRKISPAAPQVTDVGLKIKGRAAADSVPDSPSDIKKSERDNTSGKDWSRGSSRSPPRRRLRDEELFQRPRESSRDRYSERPRRRDEGGQIERLRRTRSRSPQRESFGFREERRRPRSPIHSGRTDTFRPSSRRRERVISPPRPNRGDHYSSTYTDLSGAAGRYGDSYVPGLRPRSRSPPPSFLNPRYASPHRRPRSRNRIPRSRRASLERSRPKRRSSPGCGSKIESETTASSYRTVPHSGNSSRRHKEPSGHQDQSQSPSRRGSRNPGERRKSPNHPVEREGARGGGRTKMQSSALPMQNTINDGSRPSSPPRPIPSYEAAPQSSATMSEAFPLHGMKASDVHGAHRPSRPPHLNTQQSYSTSPQWTPTSSHHNSPHSGSPFSQGRGGWGGQQQQYHGQPR